MNAKANRSTATRPIAEWLAPARTALLIVDMQVDFALPDGVLGQAGVDLSTVPAAVAAAMRLAEGARAADLPVIFVGLQTSAKTDSPAWRERAWRLGEAASEGLCRQGEPGDRVIAKTRYSGFFDTDLHATLMAMKVDTLVICGLTTECCVDCTVRDAFQLDYQVFIAADACTAYETDLHEGALKALALNCAIVVDSADVIGAWQALT